MRRELERIEIPGEHEARARTWELVRTAYEGREPVQRSRPFMRPLAVLAGALALVAAVLSPPGRAVVQGVREAIGITSAEESLFSLPSPGQLLVTGTSGVWVVASDGSKRRLGDYRDASWSPFGRYVAATRRNELAALEPDGDVRWKLARPRVHDPAWGGSTTDTRIAYATDGRLHVVAGDGRNDVEAGGSSSPALVRPVWRPRSTFELSYLDTRGFVHTFGAETARTNWISQRLPDARSLAWFPDGNRLLVVGRGRLIWLRGRDGAGTAIPVPGLLAAAPGPNGELAYTRRRGGRSELVVEGGVRFSGTGTFTDLEWSPDGRWILVAWRDADQWLFVGARGPRRVRAVANVRQQFDSKSFPSLSGWCCP